MPLEVLAIIWAVKWLTGTWKLHMGEDLLYISLNFCITERDTRWSLTAAGNKSYMIIKAARHSFLPTFWKQGHLFSAAIDFAYHISINKTLSQVLTFILWREHYSLPHPSCVRNLQAAWEEFIGVLHIHVATYTTLNNFIILSVILFLRSWGWAHTAFAVLTSAFGRELAVVLSPQEHHQCLSQLQGLRDLKLWLSCWHWCVHASYIPSLLENGSDGSFLKWSFLLSNPSHPERENCLQGSGVAEISPFPPCALVEGAWVSGGKKGAADVPWWPSQASSAGAAAAEGSWEAVAEWWRALLPDGLTSDILTKKGETSAKDISELCVSLLVEQLGMLFWRW